MSEQGKKEAAKRPYVRPKIVKVKLLAEEAILSGCKVTDGGSAQSGASGTCNHTTHSPCSASGS